MCYVLLLLLNRIIIFDELKQRNVNMKYNRSILNCYG